MLSLGKVDTVLWWDLNKELNESVYVCYVEKVNFERTKFYKNLESVVGRQDWKRYLETSEIGVGRYFRRRSKESVSVGKVEEILEELQSYTREVVEGQAESVRLEDIALPPEGFKPVSVEKLFSEEEWRKMNDENEMLVEGRTARSCDKVRKHDYAKLLGMLAKRGMVDFETDTGDKLSNGFFGVAKKDTSQRLISDLRRSNTLLREPPKTFLPSADLYVLLGDDTRLVFGCDLSDYFHTIENLPLLRRVQGFKPIRKQDLEGILSEEELSGLGDSVRPRQATLAMGGSWSVHIAQSVHVNMMTKLETVYDGGNGVKLFIVKNASEGPEVISEARTFGREGIAILLFLYIDDGNGVAISRRRSEREIKEVVNDFQTAQKGLYEEHGFILQERKIFPGSKRQEITGIEFDLTEGGGIGLAADKLYALSRKTNKVVRRGRFLTTHFKGYRIKTKILEHLVGKWVFTMMCKRAGLSVLSEVYRCVHGQGGRKAVCFLTEKALVELDMCTALGPSLVHWLRKSSDLEVTCFDASERGYGVVSRKGDTNLMKEIESCLEFRGCYTRLERTEGEEMIADKKNKGSVLLNEKWRGVDCKGSLGELLRDKAKWPRKGHYEGEKREGGKERWRVIRRGRWKREEHVNILEIRAARMAVDHAVRKGIVRGEVRTILGDSRVALGALSKGRSSSWQLLRECRKAASTLLSSGLNVNWVWIDTKSNPADVPSRW